MRERSEMQSVGATTIALLSIKGEVGTLYNDDRRVQGSHSPNAASHYVSTQVTASRRVISNILQ